ncbi:MAG: hypothetical protein ACYC61_31475, partial [Isosphaeraceae bacterium]
RQVEELIRHLGPEWALVDLPDAAAAGASRPKPHPVLVATVDDGAAFDRLASQLAAEADRKLGELEKSQKKGAAGDERPTSYGMKRLPAPDRGYRVDVPAIWFGTSDGSVRLDILDGQQHSLFLVIGERSVALGYDLDTARRALKHQGMSARPWQATGEVARALEGLPSSLIFLSVSDPERCGIPGWIAGVPGMIRWLTTGAIAIQDTYDKTAWVLLNLLGQPRPGQVWLRLAPQEVPTAEEIRSYFLPSVLAAAVDERGYRIIQREPLPFAGLASELAFHQGWKLEWNPKDGPQLRIRFNVTSPWIDSKR